MTVFTTAALPLDPDVFRLDLIENLFEENRESGIYSPIAFGKAAKGRQQAHQSRLSRGRGRRKN